MDAPHTARRGTVTLGVEPGRYSDRYVIEMVAVVSLAGGHYRWNGFIATVTDRESVKWAEGNLKAAVRDQGVHAGATHEQRRKHPRATDHMTPARSRSPQAGVADAGDVRQQSAFPA
ncbi:MAG: hypothetical protein HC807_01970 [Gammaproteobacteria bacterium]|nr:hypothetical protein [Gammaproteobacteria bacterium]